MAKSLKQKVDILLEKYFSWAPGPMPDLSEGRLRTAEAWIEEQTRDFGLAALTLMARIQAVLRDLESGLEGPRLLARIDSSSLLKTPESILEKMVRDWDPDGTRAPRFAFQNLREMTDLGRFRIVSNFLGDAELIARTLEAPYGPARTPVTAAQEALRNDYALAGNRFDDSVYLDPAKRIKGERCHKGLFYPQLPHLGHLRVEVQIQTQLQEAWDKKDHFLVYEPRRRGEEVSLQHQCEIFAMSELLYVADLTFERLRGDILASRSAREER